MKTLGQLCQDVRVLSKHGFGPGGHDEPIRTEIDELALMLAQNTRDELSQSFNLRLTHNEWTRFTATLQQGFSTAIRHTAFDPPPFPGPKRDPWTC